jgi:hypothetical protein
MSMCWLGQFSDRRLQQFGECTFSPVLFCLLSGSANAFLTLRVGMITKEYCRCTARVEKAGLRRVATVKAAKLLGSIVREGTVKLSKATVKASKMKLSQAFERVTGRREKVETYRIACAYPLREPPLNSANSVSMSASLRNLLPSASSKLALAILSRTGSLLACTSPLK